MSMLNGWSLARLLVAVMCGAVSLDAAQKPPNIVLLVSDDQGYHDMGALRPGLITPHLDRLAKEGTQLTSFYVAWPACTPSRAAFLTGRYPHSVGMPELASPAVRGAVPVLALDRGATTIPEALKPAGYHSLAVGKWHLGFGPSDGPRAHGFDVGEFRVHVEQVPEHRTEDAVADRLLDNDRPETLGQAIAHGLTHAGRGGHAGHQNRIHIRRAQETGEIGAVKGARALLDK